MVRIWHWFVSMHSLHSRFYCTIGCVDFFNPDNAGLSFPIDALAPVVSKFEPQGLSRTDVWMLAALVANEHAAEGAFQFPAVWMGRKTCEQLNNNNCGNNHLGFATTCGAKRGPDRHLCHGDAGTSTVLNFFQNEFGFNGQQISAIMGAHTIGSMRRVNLGFEGSNGWDLTNDKLDNGYFIELVGRGQAIRSAPDWRVEVVNNNDVQGVPARSQWFINDSTQGETKKLVMLNSDVCLVRQLEDLKSGTPSCEFQNCQDVPQTLPHMIRYAADRNLFFRDYRDVTNLLVEHGYRRPAQCPQGEVCRLESV